MRATSAPASTPGTARRAVARSPSSSSSIVVVKFASCRARSTRHSDPGASIRAAATTRQARAVPAMRAFGVAANGMPKRSRKTAWLRAARRGV